jgi:phosphopantetheine--protein transferase-like protein
MLTLYTGIDLVDIERIERAVTRWGARFLRRVYTPAELALCAGRAESLAGRWAAKEAAAKLLGVGLRGIGAALGLGQLAVSLSHSRNQAVASVIAIVAEPGPLNASSQRLR